MAAQAQRADAQLAQHATRHLQVTSLPDANPRVPRQVPCRRKRVSSKLRTLPSWLSKQTTKTKRLSSSKNGQIVSKLSLLDLATTCTLRAKWISKIFCSEQWFTYEYLWIEQWQVISDLHNFRYINHLIASSRNLNKTSKKMSKFTHACMEVFMAMKFKVKNPLSWEFIMDQPIFYNKCITNPNTV